MSRPLDGRRIVVSRPEGQAQPLASRLRELGAEITVLPLVAIVPRDDDPQVATALAGLDRYDAIVLTSANAAEIFTERLADTAQRIPEHALVVAVGQATADALARAGITVHMIPPVATGAAVAAALAQRGVAGRRILLPRARDGRPELPAGLRSAGALVDDVAFYDTAPLVPGPSDLAAAEGADAIVLTSPSAVAVLAAAAGPAAVPHHHVIAIGPTTAAAARDAGFTVLSEAGEQSVEGLVAATVQALGRDR